MISIIKNNLTNSEYIATINLSIIKWRRI